MVFLLEVPVVVYRLLDSWLFEEGFDGDRLTSFKVVCGISRAKSVGCFEECLIENYI